MDSIEEIKERLMKLHQEKLELALGKKQAVYLDKQELEDICEFFNCFLYD